MKINKNIHYLIAVLFVSLLFGSCTSSLRLNVLQPAAVNVHPDIKSIAIANRTKPQNKASNIIEGVLTGEGLFQDRSGIEKALGGLVNTLQNSPRFKVVMTDVYLQGSGAGVVFPNPLDWKEVEEICKKYNTDVLCTIETYDSDTRVLTNKNITRRKGSDGKEYNVVEFIATQTVSVQLGFRLYDPVDKTIIDQFHFTEQNNWTSKGANEMQAVGGLINRSAASDQVSNSAGVKYAIRISPTWVWVTRVFYSKGGHEKMKTAGRFAKANNWKEARAIWMGLQGEKRKTAGKAAYNIAVSYEYEGNLEEAKKWASTAYSNFGNKKGRSYVYILERRMADVKRLEGQMQSVD